MCWPVALSSGMRYLYSSKILKFVANPLNNITYHSWRLTHTIQSINHNLGATLYNYFLYVYIPSKKNTFFHPFSFSVQRPQWEKQCLLKALVTFPSVSQIIEPAPPTGRLRAVITLPSMLSLYHGDRGASHWAQARTTGGATLKLVV